jgi:hypothetical protein
MDAAGAVVAMASRRVRLKAIAANGRHPRHLKYHREPPHRQHRLHNPEPFAPVEIIRARQEAMTAARAKIDIKRRSCRGLARPSLPEDCGACVDG